MVSICMTLLSILKINRHRPDRVRTSRNKIYLNQINVDLHMTFINDTRRLLIREKTDRFILVQSRSSEALYLQRR